MFSFTGQKIQTTTLALLMSAGLATGTHATTSVMAIGDSLTWGYIKENPDGSSSSTAQSNGGWRVPLEDALNSSSILTDTFNFVGVRGDNNDTTVPAEFSGSPDEFDGDTATGISLHEGYSGWYIQRTNRPGATGTRDGILDNLTSNGGAIAPQNADIIMVAIGVNDLIGLNDGGTSPGQTVNDLVADLSSLIDDIVTLAPTSTVFVSTLLPIRDDGLFGGLALYDDVDTDIAAFNAQLLSSQFGGSWTADGAETEAYAEHTTYGDSVVLLNAFNAIESGEFDGDIVDDGIHLTSSGYDKLGNWYADRFESLVPEPSSAILLMLGGVLVRGRRRRSA